MFALALGGCAAGQGQDTDNPFGTAPQPSGMAVTDVPATDGGATDGMTDGVTGNSNTATGQVDTSVSDATSEPVDPTENPDPDCIDADGGNPRPLFGRR